MRTASVVRLVPKPERITRSAANEAATALMALPSHIVPPFVLQTMLSALHRVTAPDTETASWRFNMLSPAQAGVVWDAIEKLPSRDQPRTVDRVFKLVLLNLRMDTGEVMLTRDQFADRIGCAPREISRAMSVLERLGVIMRERRRVDGMCGPGMVAYFVNPHVAWNGNLTVRGDLAEDVEPPLLKLMQGGKRDDEKTSPSKLQSRLPDGTRLKRVPPTGKDQRARATLRITG